MKTERELLDIAIQNRMPDAMMRAERMRDRCVKDARDHLEKAQIFAGMIEAGIDYRFTSPDAWVDLRDEAQKHIDEALRLGGEASNLADLVAEESKRHSIEGGMTAEQLFQISRNKKGDPVARLYANNHLDEDHVRAAREIEACMRHAVHGLGLKTMRFPIKPGEDEFDPPKSREDFALSIERISLLHAKVYVPWAARFRAAVPLVLGLIEGESLKALAIRNAMGWSTALGHVQVSLSAYARESKLFKKDREEFQSAA